MLRTCCVVAVALCLVAGCGSDLGLVPVEGTVTLDGKPLANKSLLFTPELGEGPSASAITDGSGKYELLAVVTGTTSDVKGAVPGPYKVSVFEPIIPVEGGDEMGGVLIPGEKMKTDIPVIYQSQDRTPLKAEVPEGGGTVDLQLSSQ